MKIAVCMSGHFRFAEYTSRQNKWFYDLLKSKYDVDIFLHTWSDKSKVILLDHLYEFTDIHIDKNIPNTQQWWGQWISLSRCLDLANKSDVSYDVVMRTRPDNLIFQIPNGDNIDDMLDRLTNNDLLLSDSIWGHNEVLYIQDQLFTVRYDIFNSMFNIDNVMAVLKQSVKNTKIDSVSTIGFLMQHLAHDKRVIKSGSYTGYFNQKLCREPHLEIDPLSLKYPIAREIYNNYRTKRANLKYGTPLKNYEDWI